MTDGRVDAAVAIRAAAAGASVLRARYARPLTRFAKSATDFATEADIEAERAIQAVIGEAFPNDAFVGEEAGLSGSADAARTWLVDPLCGTLNFAAQTSLASVNVALRTGRELTAAAVADPFGDEVFWTDGTTVAVRRDADVPVAPDSISRLVDVDFDRQPAWGAALVGSEPFTSRFGLRVSSTSLALAWVAAGRRAGYVVAGDIRDSVHFAAGIALCRVARCVVTDLRGAELDGSPRGLIAAADLSTHAALVDAARLSG